MKRLDERPDYPPARWCPACKRLHNGAVVPKLCQCGEPTAPVPQDLIPPSERNTPRWKYRISQG